MKTILSRNIRHWLLLLCVGASALSAHAGLLDKGGKAVAKALGIGTEEVAVGATVRAAEQEQARLIAEQAANAIARGIQAPLPRRGFKTWDLDEPSLDASVARGGIEAQERAVAEARTVDENYLHDLHSPLPSWASESALGRDLAKVRFGKERDAGEEMLRFANRHAGQFARTSSDREDIAAEACAKLTASLRRTGLQGIKDPAGYTHTAVRNAAADFYKRGRAERAMGSMDDLAVLPMAKTVADPFQLVSARQAIAAIQKTATPAQLPVLRGAGMGKTAPEIAKELQRSEETVRKQLAAGRSRVGSHEAVKVMVESID